MPLVVRKDGRMAQLVEHIVHIDGVTGSSPVATTGKEEVSQWLLFFDRFVFSHYTGNRFRKCVGSRMKKEPLLI